MQAVLSLANLAASSSMPVLITGESGTGKELIARHVHSSSPRAERSFVPVNLAAMPEGLVESELFGHIKGAFTGAGGTRTGLIEEADGGTLFLDEIGDMPMPAQVKLLRVLQDRQVRSVGSDTERPIDFRLVCATHKNLPEEIKAGRFREDLFYRISVLEIDIPPLRLRRADTVAFIAAFAERKKKRLPKSIRKALYMYTWPGNVRELENVLERFYMLSEAGLLTYVGALERLTAPDEVDTDYNIPDNLAAAMLKHVDYVFKKYGMRKIATANALGINPSTLYRIFKAQGRTIGVSDRNTPKKWRAAAKRRLIGEHSDKGIAGSATIVRLEHSRRGGEVGTGSLPNHHDTSIGESRDTHAPISVRPSKVGGHPKDGAVSDSTDSDRSVVSADPLGGEENSNGKQDEDSKPDNRVFPNWSAIHKWFASASRE